MIRSRQILQGKAYDLVKVFLTDARDHPARHVQAAHRHRSQVIADHPCPLPVDGRGHRKGHGVVRLRLRGERQNRDAPVQLHRLRHDQARAALPELWKLGVLGKIAPIDLPDSWGRFDPGAQARRWGFVSYLDS